MTSSYNIVAPDYIQGYLKEVHEDSIKDALNKSGKTFRKLLKSIPDYKIDYAYATDKWTIKEVLQHIIDAERVFAFRALWFARKDVSPLPGFEENSWAANVKVVNREWEDMIEEFKSIRKTTKLLFASFTDEELNTIGIASNYQITVATIGFLCAGHLYHHINIINERYL